MGHPNGKIIESPIGVATLNFETKQNRPKTSVLVHSGILCWTRAARVIQSADLPQSHRTRSSPDARLSCRQTRLVGVFTSRHGARAFVHLLASTVPRSVASVCPASGRLLLLDVRPRILSCSDRGSSTGTLRGASSRGLLVAISRGSTGDNRRRGMDERRRAQLTHEHFVSPRFDGRPISLQILLRLLLTNNAGANHVAGRTKACWTSSSDIAE